ncbi:MAG: tetraacyldisaccharide 4'-kinase [Bradyrhizobiaceae bacterium]|nr:tetraacyldisaccharide 4'-kinase [Bradyrhizobiaceae bacterium]
MRAPAFYFQPPGFLSALLSPLGAVYGAVAAARMRKRGARAGVPVICVGNPTLGGAGKTPTALALAEMLAGMGERPFFLSRGYGGSEAGPLVVDAAKHRAAEVGDEPLLLARAFPTIVARDRAAGARLAVERGAGVLVLDDGFQNPSLAKDCALLVIDDASGIGNGRVFPAGPLRAPLEAQLTRAQGIVLVGEGGAASSIVKQAEARKLPLFRAKLVPDSAAAAELTEKKVLAFAGIGHPEKFFATLAALGADVVEKRAFPDHHRFSASDAEALLAAAKARGLILVTTDKDLARLKGEPSVAELAVQARALPVQLRFEDAGGVQRLLEQALKR